MGDPYSVNSPRRVLSLSRRRKESPSFSKFDEFGSSGQHGRKPSEVYGFVGAITTVVATVAATKSPVIFIGTGEHMDELEVFDMKPFVSRLLGMGDWTGFMDKIHEVVTMDQQPELLQKLSEGSFTLRIMYDQFQNLLKMGPIGQVFSMLPGFSAELMPKGHKRESQAKIKRYVTIMDSMTDEELDSTNPKIMNESRIMRIARGSGRQVRDVADMLEEYKRLAKIWSKRRVSSYRRRVEI